MIAGQIPHLNGRLYTVPPENKSLRQCWRHGDYHRAYHRINQLDSRWSQEQVDAYMNGYNGIPLKEDV